MNETRANPFYAFCMLKAFDRNVREYAACRDKLVLRSTFVSSMIYHKGRISLTNFLETWGFPVRAVLLSQPMKLTSLPLDPWAGFESCIWTYVPPRAYQARQGILSHQKDRQRSLGPSSLAPEVLEWGPRLARYHMT